jgi:hypothetical protein
MSEPIRSTRTCSVSQIQPELFQAIQEFFQSHKLGVLETETLQCCETVSNRPIPGKLDSLLEGNPDSTSHLAVLLTQEWLIWARNGNRSGTLVTGARLKGLQVKLFTARRTKNMELEISAFFGDSKEFAKGSLELGPDLAAQQFCEEVGQAVLKVNPPVKRKFPKWMGG